MKRHLLLIGFSCTGKTYLGREVFGANIIDSDDELLKWIREKEKQPFDHVYKIYMKLGRDRALNCITEAEEALVHKWEGDRTPRIISLGPGFPLRDNWKELCRVSHVVLFKRSPLAIYGSLKKRREQIFECCPEAREHDNWDIDVLVDSNRKEFSQEVAINQINKRLTEREARYTDNDDEVDTENTEDALRKLRELKITFESNRL